MQQSVKERITIYLKHKGIGQNKFENLAGISNGYISNLKSTPGTTHLTKILNAAPDLNQHWLLTGEGEMLGTNNAIQCCNNTGVPYYNIDFTLGFDILENDQTVQPEYFINFPPYNKCTCWINARGDSMAPTISAGDIVALQRIEDFHILISGEIYAIVTRNGLRTIKRVNDLGDSLRLIPDNKEYNEQVIQKSEILSVFYVKGNVKAF